MEQQTLWIYGDSFADTNIYSEQEREKLWPNVTADLLSIQTSRSWTVENFSCIGSSLEFSYHQLRTSLGLFKHGDMVVFLITDPSRCWFIQNRPDMSNVFTHDLDDQIEDPQMVDAVASYFRHIFRPELAQLKVTPIMEAIAYWGLRHPTMTYLVIPCFPLRLIGQEFGVVSDQHSDIGNQWHYPSLVKTQGNLLHVQQQEFCRDEKDSYLSVKNWKGWDLRYNHLTLSNHKILAKKISKFYSDKIPVDLRVGFNQNLFSYECLEDINLIDPVLREKELSPLNIERFLKGSKAAQPAAFFKKVFK